MVSLFSGNGKYFFPNFGSLKKKEEHKKVSSITYNKYFVYLASNGTWIGTYAHLLGLWTLDKKPIMQCAQFSYIRIYICLFETP